MSAQATVIRRAGMFVELDVMQLLMQNAIDSTFYVAGGKVLARDMASKYGIPLEVVEQRIAKMATKLVDHIRELS